MQGFLLYSLLLLTAPLYFGANRPVPILLLELLALVLFFYCLRSGQFSEVGTKFKAFALALFLLPALQLIPLPLSLWAMMPGHDVYAQALSASASLVDHSFRPWSVVPSATENSWLALIPPLAVFLYTLSLPKDKIKPAVNIFIFIVVFEALLGLMQYGAGADSILRLPSSRVVADATGTYANRDHLAGLLEMALPLCIAMIFAAIVQRGSNRQHTRTLRQKLAMLAASHFNRAIIYFLITIVVLLGLIFTRSRTGNMLAMVVIFMAALAFSFRLGGKNAYGLIGVLGAVAAFLALEIGMVPILNRFVLEDPMADARWIFFDDTITATLHFLPFGSGAGTFVHVFPRFQSTAFSGVYVNNAHNDYLEWLMEGGLAALALLIVFTVFYVAKWLKLLRHQDWKTTQYIQVGAGIGVFAMMLHSFLDFNLHIPANQIYLAFLVGLFFIETRDSRAPAAIGLPLETEPEMLALSEAPAAPAPQVQKLSFITENKNPFAD